MTPHTPPARLPQPPPRPRGRPRTVAPRDALDAAMRVFWAEGFDGASVDMLCRQTGMPRASLYQSFGDKQGLFLAAIAHYVETRIAPVTDALGPSGPLERDLAAFFDRVVALATDDPVTPGCLISCVLAEVAGSNPRFRTELASRFTALEQRIAARLLADPAFDAARAGAVAGVLAAVARGLMLRARAGAAPGDLTPVARQAVTCTTGCDLSRITP